MLVTITDIQNNDDATPELWNSRFGALANVLNGNVDSDNIATGGVTATELATNAVTAGKIQDRAVTPAKVALGHTYYTAYNGSTSPGVTGNTWTTLTANDAASGSKTITTYGGDLKCTVHAYINISAGNGELGVQVNGTDYQILTGAGNSWRSGSVIVTGLPAGTYTVQPRVKASGGGTITMSQFNALSMVVEELPTIAP